MRRSKTLVAAMLVSLSCISAVAGDADFTLVNNTGFTIFGVYLAPTKSKSWGNERLGSADLENGRSRLIKFRDSANCVQDLAIYLGDDATETVWNGFDLCTINKLTLKYNRSTKVVNAIEE